MHSMPVCRVDAFTELRFLWVKCAVISECFADMHDVGIHRAIRNVLSTVSLESLFEK